MKRIIKNVFALASIVAMLSSCAVTLPVEVTDNPIGSKKGVSKSTVILGVYLNGKYGIADAVKNGKMKGGVSTVDEKTTSYLIFSTRELIVTGE